MSEVRDKFSSLNARARDIFHRIVDAYIETGQPVGSKTIAGSLPTNLSPASVRNVMSDLERCGLISAPHTSAGRIPTETGFRFFVDACLENSPLANDQRATIDAHLKNLDRSAPIEAALAEATNLLSGLSQCAGVVVTPKANPRLKHIEFIRLSTGRGLVVLVGEDGSVENRTLEMPPDFPASSLQQATNFFNTRFAGKTIDEIETLVSEEIERAKLELDEITARVIESGIATWAGSVDGTPKNLLIRGQANLLANEDAFAAVDRMRLLFEDFESKKDMLELLGRAQDGQGVRIFIGSENELFSLSGSSVIVSPYKDANEQVVGVLGVVGPTRLDYARVIPMVDYTAKIIGKLIT